MFGPLTDNPSTVFVNHFNAWGTDFARPQCLHVNHGSHVACGAGISLSPTRRIVDPYMVAKQEKNLSAPLPWLRSQSEVMVDAMSVMKYFYKRNRVSKEDMLQTHDFHSYWPLRVFMAVQKLTRVYGKDRPPSPWRPVIAVYDIPDPRDQSSGLKIRRWRSLFRQGPRPAAGMTLAWAQTYVDQSAAERYRCDKEILWMLELLTRDYPRKQVLVTEDKWLAKQAKRFCTVRGAQWLKAEILAADRGSTAGAEALQGSEQGVEHALGMLPKPIRQAFVAQ